VELPVPFTDKNDEKLSKGGYSPNFTSILKLASLPA